MQAASRVVAGESHELGQVVVLADRRLPVPGGLQQYQPGTPTATPGR